MLKGHVVPHGILVVESSTTIFTAKLRLHSTLELHVISDTFSMLVLFTTQIWAQKHVAFFDGPDAGTISELPSSDRVETMRAHWLVIPYRNCRN